MQEYRNNILWRFRLLVICLVVLALYLGLILCEFLPNSLQPVNETVAEFQGGLISGFIVLATLLIIRYAKALKGEAVLKAMYRQEHDERMKYIRQKSGMPMVMLLSSALIACGIVAGYYNILVFYTLVIAGVVQLTIGAIVKMVYRKML